MTVKVESFTAKVKCNLRVIDLILSHEKEMGAESHLQQSWDETKLTSYLCFKKRFVNPPGKKPIVGTKEKCLSHISSNHLFLCINKGPVIVTGISLLYQRRAFYRDRHEQRRHPFPFHGMRSRLLLSNYAWLLILSIFLSSISFFLQIDMGWESV